MREEEDVKWLPFDTKYSPSMKGIAMNVAYECL
jgi:hypothetical protein